jgi:endonuclease III
MFYDGPTLVAHYQRWLNTYREPIEAKLTTALSHRDQNQAVRNAMEVLLTEVLPMAMAEMILFNNGRLEEQIQENGGGCSSCATNLK